MSREAPVRFCEGPGVQFPRATRLLVLVRMGNDDIPVSLHSTCASARQAATVLGRSPEALLDGLGIDWPRGSLLTRIAIVHFEGSRAVETVVMPADSDRPGWQPPLPRAASGPSASGDA